MGADMSFSTVHKLLIVTTVLVMAILFFPFRGLPVMLYILWCIRFLVVPAFKAWDDTNM